MGKQVDKKKQGETVQAQESDEKAGDLADTHIEELQAQLAVCEDKWKRALADYQNLENRMREQRADWVKSANKELLLRLLPVLDTLILAHQHTQDKTLAVSIGQFLDILKIEGVTKVETTEKEFDPVTMECVMTEEGEEGKVLEELRPGYMLYEKVMRPAQVKVGKEN